MFIAVPFESPPAQLRTPWATCLLTLLYVLIYWRLQGGELHGDALLAQVDPASFTGQFAHHLTSDAGSQWLSWLTAPFLHASTGHLLTNVGLLLTFGLSLEMMLGRATFLALYLLSGWVGLAVGVLGLGGSQGLLMGATGSVAGLAAAYAVFFQRRRIRFAFWRGTQIWLLRWPAWVALLALPLLLLAQMLLTGRPAAVSLMAMGGMLTGGALTFGRMLLHPHWALASSLPPLLETAPATMPANLPELIERAQELGDKHEDMPRATLAWRAVARHARTDPKVLTAWFDCAVHDPCSDDFHTAARYIFKLPDTSRNRQLKHDVWRTYTRLARPATRLSNDTRHGLARTFITLGEFGSAETICQSLRKQPDHPMWPGTLAMLVNGLARSGQMEQARYWLPLLQRDAPDERVTQWLSLLP